ncbi:sugar transferase [Nocardioides sp. SYSU DS0651]|uniref:sugar transferase n=1 Tax=Nocardioides sp. SYSU DS0651 TaxID=3415955 RepID=UPI003F4B2674
MSAVRAPVDLRPDAATVPSRLAAVPAAQTPQTPQVPPIEVRDHGRARRVLELLVATTALAALLPLLALIAVLVVTTSRGPVLYRQQRIGAGGRPFEIVKFRTMEAGADRAAEAVFAAHDDGSGPLNKRHDDPRVTLPGRWLRRYSLDELPQLWNVLNGTMALVGPRPSVPREVARFAPGDHARCSVRPGITGLAQVSGRSDLAWEEAVRLDLHYAEHRSLALDVRILLRTVPAVLRARGAY